MSRRQKQVFGRIGGLILLALLALFMNQYQTEPEEVVVQKNLLTDVVEVHFIDVGQGDSILIEAGTHSMLIDAGENNKGMDVVNYLHQRNITELDYIIGTHPHSDHIGGLDTVIESFDIDKVIMPEVAHTTQSYEEVLDALEEKGLSITKPIVGTTYEFGAATFTIIAPNNVEYEDLNDYSVGVKLSYGNNSFLLTGDASKISEEEILKNGIDISANVLKLSHHGSSTSNTNKFLDAVNPTYVVISLGEDNEYGHPHTEVLQSIYNRNLKVYRTDKQGTVVFTSDGKNISVNTESYNITKEDLIRD